MDPLDEYMASINAEVAALDRTSTDGKKSNFTLPIVSRAEEEDEVDEEEDEPVDSETLKNLSVEEMLSYTIIYRVLTIVGLHRRKPKRRILVKLIMKPSSMGLSGRIFTSSHRKFDE